MGKQNQQSSGVVMHCRRNGVVGPVLVCGGCGKRIADACAGVVLWNGAAGHRTAFAHVGECAGHGGGVRRTGLDAAFSVARLPGEQLPPEVDAGREAGRCAGKRGLIEVYR